MMNFLSYINTVFLFLFFTKNPIIKKFSKFERRFFDKFFLIISEDEKEIFLSQLSEINYIQRVLFKEIDFYKLGFGYTDFSRMRKFHGDREIKGSIIFGESKDKIKFKIYIINGNFFSIEFNKSIERYINNLAFDIKLTPPKEIENQ